MALWAYEGPVHRARKAKAMVLLRIGTYSRPGLRVRSPHGDLPYHQSCPRPDCRTSHLAGPPLQDPVGGNLRGLFQVQMQATLATCWQDRDGGPGGVSTALWYGVMASYYILHWYQATGTQSERVMGLQGTFFSS